MDILLPVAGISINIFLLIGAGVVVGFLSGMFGVVVGIDFPASRFGRAGVTSH